MIYLNTFRGLQEEGVRYVVVGGLAMNFAQDEITCARWQAVRRRER